MHRRARTALIAPAAALVARRLRGWFPVRVAGESMRPTLQPGDLLAVRPVAEDEPRAGQIVVVRAYGLEVVKRVRERPSPDLVWIEGDNAAASTDSRLHGAVPRDAVVGVVRARYWPPSRVRLL